MIELLKADSLNTMGKYQLGNMQPSLEMKPSPIPSSGKTGLKLLAPGSLQKNSNLGGAPLENAVKHEMELRILKSQNSKISRCLIKMIRLFFSVITISKKTD